MDPGLVPLAPFGHSRRRDDDREVQPHSSPYSTLKPDALMIGPQRS